MLPFSGSARLCACALLLYLPHGSLDASPGAPPSAIFSSGTETLHYSVEWRLFNAGTAKLSLIPEFKPDKPRWRSDLHLESAGVIAAFYKVVDDYDVHLEDDFCAVSSTFSAQEGKRSRETRVSYDRSRGRATYVEKDRLHNSILHAGQLDVPACISDVMGGLYRLRTMNVQPGQTARIGLSNGRKAAQVRVEAQEREEVQTKIGKFKTIRYEAYLFNGVLFDRKARLEIWLSDDGRKLPVQIRVRLPIVIGNITFQLEKEERT